VASFLGAKRNPYYPIFIIDGIAAIAIPRYAQNDPEPNV
jgi:hypothetical protein